MNDVITNSRSAKVGHIRPKNKVDILRRKFENLDRYSEERLRQDISNPDGKAGPRSVLCKAEKLKTGPRSPLVRLMQNNEKKWAESFKRKKEENSLKKIKKKEKEAKLKADEEKRKGKNEIQMLYDKFMASQKSKKLTLDSTKIVTSNDIKKGSKVSKEDTLLKLRPKWGRTPTEKLDFQQLAGRGREVERQKETKGSLPSTPFLTDSGPKSIFLEPTHRKESRLEHMSSRKDRANDFEEKLSKFQQKIDLKSGEKLG